MPPVAKKTAASSNNYGTTKRNVRKSGKTRKRRPDSSDSDDSTSSVQQSIGNVYDSDNLDDDSPASGHKRRTSTKIRSPRKKRKVLDVEDEYELEEGQELVGVVVQAPKTGLVPPGQISSNTFEFLTKLKDVKCNNRTWFKLNEPVYRAAEKEWKAFVERFTDLLIDVDSQIPHLPPKDVIHRIYRDVRFSNDKTPYKKNLSASFSRSGRKGIFAGYHISINPGNESLIAAGSWCPQRDELAAIRNNIKRNPQRLRDVISSPDFVKYFGEAKPHPKGERRNIFGGEDELKNAPKGVEKDHKDIDLLKCRSFAVAYRFPDSQVLSPDFTDKLTEVAKVMRPFVHCLNDMMTFQDEDGDEEDGTDGDE